MAKPIVFIDIAGPDDRVLKEFHSTVFEWEQDESGQFSSPIMSPIDAAIRKDPAGNPMGLVEMDGNRPRVPL